MSSLFYIILLLFSYVYISNPLLVNPVLNNNRALNKTNISNMLDRLDNEVAMASLNLPKYDNDTEDTSLEKSNISYPVKLSTFKHKSSAKSVALSHDSNTALIGLVNNTAILLNLTDRSNPTILSHLNGHKGENWIHRGVFSVALSYDTSIALTGSEDNTAILWNITDKSNPTILSHLIGHTDDVRSVALSSDASIVLTGSEDCSAILWSTIDKSNPIVISRLNGHNYYFCGVYSVALSHDANMALTGSQDCTVILWNITNKSSPQILSTLKGHTSWVTSVVFSHDSNMALAGSADCTVILWNITNKSSPQILSTLKNHTNWVINVVLSHDSNIALTGSWDKTAILWNITNKSSPQILSTLKCYTCSVALSRDSNVALTYSWDGTDIWGLASESRKQKPISIGKVNLTNFNHDLNTSMVNVTEVVLPCIENYTNPIPNVTYLEEVTQLEKPESGTLKPAVIWGATAFAMITGGTALLYKCYKNRKLKDNNNGLNLKQKFISKTLQDFILKMIQDIEDLESSALSDLEIKKRTEDLKRKFALFVMENIEKNDGFIFAQDLEKLLPIEYKDYIKQKIREEYEESIVFTGCGSLTSSGNDIAKVWNICNFSKLSKIEKILKILPSKSDLVSLSHDNKKICDDTLNNKTLYVWSIDNPNILYALETKSRVNSLAISSDKRLVLVGYFDNVARLFEMQDSLKFKAEFHGHSGPINCVSFSPDSNFAITGSEDKTARVWDLNNTKASLHILDGHDKSVTAVAISYDNKLVLTSSGDNSAILWNIENSKTAISEGKLKGGADSSVNFVTFSSNNKTALTSYNGDFFKLWDISDLKNIVSNGKSLSSKSNPIITASKYKFLVTNSIDMLIKIWSLSNIFILNLDLSQIFLFIKLANLRCINSPVSLSLDLRKSYIDIINTLDYNLRKKVLELYPEFVKI